MPPRARGKGTARTRGAGRGNASTSQTTVGATDLEETTPVQQRNAASDPSETLTGPVMPKEEDDGDSKTPTSGANSPPAPGLQVSASVTASKVTESPHIGSEPSSRPPVQRLGSLQGAIPPSGSASPAVRGRGGTIRGKRGMAKPTFTGRRSKEEREALAKEQREKDSMRNAERDAAIRQKEQDEAQKAKREAKHALRARGGYSGAMSGPFSMGSSREDRKVSSRSNATPGIGSGSGSRASRVKHEGDSSAGPSHQPGRHASSLKKEDEIYVSSDEEDDAEFPRKDIDFIEISSDEHETTPDAIPRQRPARTALPVRIGRKEHQERTFGINTETSAEISIKMGEQTEAGSQALAATSSQQALRKGKSKAKDVEITGVRKPFRGVWQDAEDSELSVKAEFTTDDENMVDVRQIGAVGAPSHPAKRHEASSPDAERSLKARLKAIPAPVLQTDEDRAEWARFQSNLRHIRAELGPEETPTLDAAGDVVMADDAAKAGKGTVRDNNVYLFQIPPLMPELLSPGGIKKEQSEGPSGSTVAGHDHPSKVEAKVKLEEGGFSDPTGKHASGPRFASGFVGKLRVRESGRTTLDWGGTSYELTPGNKASFLQEVVSVKVVPEKDRVVPEDAGEAVSLGRVKGKFIVVPDWDSVLA